jgi:hypothetical protein
MRKPSTDQMERPGRKKLRMNMQAGRFTGIPLKFKCHDHRGRKIKGKLLNICLASVYHPCHDTPYEESNKVLNSLLQHLPRSSHIVMGADINAKLGQQDSDELSPVLGPHGPSHQNTRGTNLFSLYLSNGL